MWGPHSGVRTFCYDCMTVHLIRCNFGNWDPRGSALGPTSSIFGFNFAAEINYHHFLQKQSHYFSANYSFTDRIVDHHLYF